MFLFVYRLAGGSGFNRLLMSQNRNAAVDISLRQSEMRIWFSGQNLQHAGFHRRTYPPASYMMLYPVMGWLTFAEARAVWAFLSILLLGLLSYFSIRSVRPDTKLETAFWLLLPLALTSTAVCIGNGQLALMVVAELWAAIYLIHAYAKSWQRDCAAGILLLLALVKPQMSLPFIWILLFKLRAIRPILIALAGYLALTAAAVQFQPSTPLIEALTGWVHSGLAVAKGMEASFLEGLFIETGKGDWILYYAFAVFFMLGFWVWHYRTADIWLLAGVTAFAARLWIFTRVYGDFLILIPLIAVFRILKKASVTSFETVMGAVLFWLTLGILTAPGDYFEDRWVWNVQFRIMYTTVWLTLLGYLWYHAQKETGASGTV